MNIFIVMGTSGQYSDRCTWVQKAFENKENAEKYIEILSSADDYFRQLYYKVEEEFEGTTWSELEYPKKKDYPSILRDAQILNKWDDNCKVIQKEWVKYCQEYNLAMAEYNKKSNESYREFLKKKHTVFIEYCKKEHPEFLDMIPESYTPVEKSEYYIKEIELVKNT